MSDGRDQCSSRIGSAGASSRSFICVSGIGLPNSEVRAPWVTRAPGSLDAVGNRLASAPKSTPASPRHALDLWLGERTPSGAVVVAQYLGEGDREIFGQLLTANLGTPTMRASWEHVPADERARLTAVAGLSVGRVLADLDQPTYPLAIARDPLTWF